MYHSSGGFPLRGVSLLLSPASTYLDLNIHGPQHAVGTVHALDVRRDSGVKQGPVEGVGVVPPVLLGVGGAHIVAAQRNDEFMS